MPRLRVAHFAPFTIEEELSIRLDRIDADIADAEARKREAAETQRGLTVEISHLIELRRRYEIVLADIPAEDQ